MAIIKRKQPPGVKTVRREQKNPSEVLAPVKALLERLAKK